MKVIPPCSITSLMACKGYLVRPIRNGSKGEFGIAGSVEDDAEGTALIVFSEEGPLYEVPQAPDQVCVLSFGEGWFFEVDQRGPFEAYPQTMYQANGCLIREEQRWLLNAQEHGAPFRHQRAQLDLADHLLMHVSGESNNIAVFGKWTLHLGDELGPRERRIEIASFEWRPPDD